MISTNPLDVTANVNMGVGIIVLQKYCYADGERSWEERLTGQANVMFLFGLAREGGFLHLVSIQLSCSWKGISR